MATDDDSPRAESVAMRQFRQKQERENRRVFRRQGTDLFPAGGPEVDRHNAQLVESARREGEAKREAFRKSFTYDFGCDWCDPHVRYPLERNVPGDPGKTARILITPARYAADNVTCLKRAVYAFACFDCTQRLRLIAVDTKVLVTEREKVKAAARAEERARDKLAQQGLFPDERVNTDPLQNG